MNVVAQKRQIRAKAARVLLSLHAAGDLDTPSRWTWDAVDRLPAWCLASAEERTQLQLICGALYLSPDVRFWITKPALVAVQNLIGKSVFNRILAQADSMQLPRESVSTLISDFGVDPITATPEAIQDLMLAAGSDVLCATVHASLPREMLTASLGRGLGRDSVIGQDQGPDAVNGSDSGSTDITEESATILLHAAQSLQQLGQEPTNAVS